jgi:hypothetical protein
MAKKKIKDAKTGEFISREEAENRDPSTWYEMSEFNKGAFLEEVYKDLESKSYTTGFSSEVVIPLRSVAEVFISMGAKIEF